MRNFRELSPLSKLGRGDNLLMKMTSIMKNRAQVDNWNEYEPRRSETSSI
jgi:hypothetical protein